MKHTSLPEYDLRDGLNHFNLLGYNDSARLCKFQWDEIQKAGGIGTESGKSEEITDGNKYFLTFQINEEKTKGWTKFYYLTNNRITGDEELWELKNSLSKYAGYISGTELVFLEPGSLLEFDGDVKLTKLNFWEREASGKFKSPF